MKKGWTYGIIAVTVCLLVVIVVAGRPGKDASAPVANGTASPSGVPPKAPLMTVTVQRIERKTASRLLSVTGTVYARDELSVGAAPTGLIINQVMVDEGSYVHSGETLALLDTSVLEAQLEQSRAKLQGAIAGQTKTRQPNRPQDIDGLVSALDEAKATVEQESANLIQARVTLHNDEQKEKRYRQLVRLGAVAVSDANDIFTQTAKDKALELAAADQVAAAQAARAQADSKLRLARLGGSQQDVEMATASISEIRGEIRQLEAQLEQTRIVAPDDGLIVRRDAHIGDVTGGKPLFTMVRKNELELRAQVPEADLLSLHTGYPVQISGYGKQVAGYVWKITPQVDGVTRLGTARIVLPLNSSFLPGMFLHGEVREGQREVLVIPLRAVLGSANAYYVMVYDHGMVHQTSVTIGQTMGTDVELTSGGSAGTTVVVDGAGLLNDGDMATLPAGSIAPTQGSQRS